MKFPASNDYVWNIGLPGMISSESKSEKRAARGRPNVDACMFRIVEAGN
jgi:hypothetical protein